MQAKAVLFRISTLYTKEPKIFAIGGDGTSVVEVYDPAKDKWTKKTDMPTPRLNYCTEVANNRIYAIGGINNDFKTISTVEEYDPANDVWTKKSDMPVARSEIGTATVNNKIYVFGGDILLPGNSFGPASPEVFEYDPIKDIWNRKSDMPTPRNGVGAVAVDNKIYTIGGFNGGIIFPTVEIYDPTNDTWVKGVNTLNARSFPSCSVVDGKIYVIGGYNGVMMSSVEEYDTGFRPSQSIESKGKLPTTWGKKKQN